MSREEELRTLAEYGEDRPIPPPSSEEELAGRVLGRRNVILAGPPGTGKTRLIWILKARLEAEGILGVFRMVQFHREYSYQDFMQGYEPTGTGFQPKKGVFLKFLEDIAKSAANAETRNPDAIDIFAIDEINRADTSAVFGELMILLDDPEVREVHLARSGKPLSLPTSVVIIGTMNTADRSIALIDFALRRRFSFVFVPPDYPQMTAWINERGFDFDELTVESYVKAARALNARIANHPLLGRGMTLGQSLFVPKRPRAANNPFTLEEIRMAFTDSVLPQLEAYFGFGAKQELATILGPTIAKLMHDGKPISGVEIVNLVRLLVEEDAGEQA